MGPNRRQRGTAQFEALLGVPVSDHSGFGSFGDVAIEILYGEIWTRPGLSLRDRSMITVATLVALGRHDEIELHLKGALNVGISPEEIREILIQVSFYAGFPAGRSATEIANKVLDGRM